MQIVSDMADLPFEAASVIRLIRSFITYDKKHDSSLPDAETAGMLLWDISAEAAVGLVELQVVPALLAQLTAYIHRQLPGQHTTHPQVQAIAMGDNTKFSGETSTQLFTRPERIVEISCGILANLCSSPAAVQELLQQEELIDAAFTLFLDLTDAPALSEVCRLFTATLSTPECCTAWLTRLLMPDNLTWLLHIISNTLNQQLLERSLLLVATLLAQQGDATDSTSSETHPEPAEFQGGAVQTKQQQQNSCSTEVCGVANFTQTSQLLLQQGLASALNAIISTAAQCGAEEQQNLLLQSVHSDTSAAVVPVKGLPSPAHNGPGSWSDGDEDQDISGIGSVRSHTQGSALAIGPAADSAFQREADSKAQQSHHVYHQPEVLLAVLGCLEQLGQHQQGVNAALQHLPELPQLLLQLMLSCYMRDQHEVLQSLLPVLVLYRRGVLQAFQHPAQHVQLGQGKGHCEHDQSNTTRAQAADQHGVLQQRVQSPGHMQQQHGKAEEGALFLHMLATLAGVLRDIGVESLDAADAAWYLLAAGSSSLDAVVRQLQLIAPSWTLRQLQDIGQRMCSSFTPETSTVYARTCLTLMASALDSLKLPAGSADVTSAIRERLLSLQDPRPP